jgi:hypothetical protein
MERFSLGIQQAHEVAAQAWSTWSPPLAPLPDHPPTTTGPSGELRILAHGRPLPEGVHYFVWTVRDEREVPLACPVCRQISAWQPDLDIHGFFTHWACAHRAATTRDGRVTAAGRGMATILVAVSEAVRWLVAGMWRPGAWQ